MNSAKEKVNKRIRRHKRVRAKSFGTADQPRFSVFRSNQHVFLQLIDDQKARTIIGVSDVKIVKKKKTTKTEKAFEAGKELAKLAKTKKIKKVVFDRGGFAFHGRVKAAAEGARKGGLEF